MGWCHILRTGQPDFVISAAELKALLRQINDINAAEEILAAGRRRLTVGVPVLPRLARQPQAEGGEDVSEPRSLDRVLACGLLARALMRA